MRLLISPTPPETLTPDCLFLPAISSTRSPLSECDYNIHKSNSTYFTDLDMSRGNLSLLLFAHHPAGILRANSVLMILSGVQCLFRRDIKPYQTYEIWSRVLSWDEKWIYLVSHFVECESSTTKRSLFHRDGFWWSGQGTSSAKTDKSSRKVFASSVARYVFKRGRVTYPPEKMLMDCGLLPSKSPSKSGSTGEIEQDSTISTWKDIESRRQRDLPIAQLTMGWDAVHDVFDGDVKMALGKYIDTF